MESDIEFCKGIGVSEVVFGMLNEENHIDIDLTQRLAKRAFPMNITFHKAIDYTGDIMLELKSLCKVGYQNLNFQRLVKPLIPR